MSHNTYSINDIEPACLPNDWFRAEQSPDNVTLSHISKNSSIPILKYSLIIKKDMSSSLATYGQITHLNYAIINSHESLLTILKDLSIRSTCHGNPDSRFLDIVMKKGGSIYNKKGMLNITTHYNYTNLL